MPKLERLPLISVARIVCIGLACAVSLNVYAMGGQSRSGIPVNTFTEAADAQMSLRKLNGNPTQAYEIRMKLANVPGRFETVLGAAQFDVQNPGECGNIDPFIGAIPRISSNEPIALTKISDTEYTGVLYLDQILDEDYYGRAVCRWALVEARVVLKATGDDANSRFIFGLSADKLRAGKQEVRYFWSGYYPRAKMDAFSDIGDASLEMVPEDKRNEFFTITLSAKEIGS